MEARERLDRLDLYDDQIVYEQIEPISGFQPKILEDNGQSYLASNRQPASLQFMRKTMLVDGFQKPWTQSTVDLQPRIHDLPRRGLDSVVHPFVSFAPLVSFVVSAHGRIHPRFDRSTRPSGSQPRRVEGADAP